MSSSSSKTILGIVVIVIIVGGGIGAWWFLSATPTLPPNPNSVAIVFATGGLGDKSFNDGCKRGADNAKADFAMNFTYAEPTAISEYEGYIRGFAAHVLYNDPYKLIICIGFDQADALMKVAKEYPTQHFAIVDMFIDPGNYTNVASLLFNENEGSALVGAMAGMMTTTNKVGFVGGMDIPLINKFAGGFVWGANRTNPGVNFTIAYTNSWVDPAGAKTLADGMYAAGTDIIFAAAGRSGLGVIQSSVAMNGTKAYPVWSIGVDSPQMYLGFNPANNHSVVMTSMLKRVDLAVYAQFEMIHLETWSGGIYIGNLANHMVGYELNSTEVEFPQAVYTTLYSLENSIADGTLTVPQTKYWS